MPKRKSIDYKEQRKKVYKLYMGVLTKKLSVRTALSKFPKDCEDATINAAWHALCHYESDEDIRLKDSMYKEVQDEYIEFIAHTLEKGNELPENVIKSYIPYHENALIANSNSVKGIIHTLKKFLCC